MEQCDFVQAGGSAVMQAGPEQMAGSGNLKNWSKRSKEDRRSFSCVIFTHHGQKIIKYSKSHKCNMMEEQ